MKTMITIATIKKSLLQSALVIFLSALTMIANAGTGTDKAPVINPVNKVASFSASLNNSNKVDLKWSTENEVNLSHILVERSTDGKNYKDAALVFAYGNTSSKSDYSFADNISKTKTSSVYYRLIIVNEDGSIQYSETCTVKTHK